METVVLRTVQAVNVPEAALNALRSYAKNAGYGESDAAVVRYALVELSRRLGLNGYAEATK